MNDIKTLTDKATTLLNNCKAVTLAFEIDGSFSRPALFTKILSKGYDTVMVATEDAAISTQVHQRRAKLCYSDGRNDVVLMGEAEIIRDFESSEDKPHKVLLRFLGIEGAIHMDGKLEFIDNRSYFRSNMRISKAK